ncbi:hypothetical protein ACJIZ3_011060 [Penstemon smallii]|uniref:Uncharacterized protein n=1 Tax=Penstemon smallii TaxID=265156 RepID=A0ABD3UL89_9LAMI
MSYVPHRNNAYPLEICKLDQIYQLGDSISDTGNLVREIPIGASFVFSRLPYAMAVGLPFVPPYKNTDADFSYGVNFAVAGSTALPSENLASKNIFSPVTTSSLNVQLEWMSSYFSSICLKDRDCGVKLQNALFMVKEIGGNDYNYAIFEGKSMDELKNMVPEVVETIIQAVKKVISFGATRVVVPGNLPIGCLPIYQTAFQTNISESYDDNQCLKDLNEFSMYHNEQLQQALVNLKQEKPNAIIIYGDYYNAYQFLHEYASSRLIDTQKACCGIGGKFNFNMTRMCGAPDVPVCSNPNGFISWDGVHLTCLDGWYIAFLRSLNCGVQ